MTNQTLYLQTKPSRLFLKAALPGAISMLVSSLYTIFDSMFVGRFVGTTAFAALGLAFPLVIINFALADLIGIGVSVPISIFLGRKEDKKANNYFTCATLLIIITGLLMGALLYLSASFFMKLMGAEGELASLGMHYIRVYALFSPVTTMTFALDNFLRICGKLKTSMALNIGMSVGTVLLELLFILVFNWGIIGAALGATIAMFLSTAVGLAFFIKGKLQLKFVKPMFSLALIAQIFKNGVPAFLTNVAGRVFSIIMNILLLSMGGEAAVAVYGVTMTAGGVVEQLLYGILDSMQPAIGYNYGAGQEKRVLAIEKCCLSVGASVSVLFAVVFFLFPTPIAVLFLEDISLLPLATHALRISAFTYLFRWIGHAIQSFFMALERPLPSMSLSLASAFVFPLLLLAVLSPLKLNGLWLNYALTAFLTAILAVVLILKLKKNLFLQSKTEE